MASLNINNHIKSSLEFVHPGTEVLLRYSDPFPNQKPFQSLLTLYATELAFVSKKDHAQKSMGIKSGNEGGHISSLQNLGKWREHHSEFFWRERKWSLLDFWLLCEVFVGDKDLFCCLTY